MSRRATVTDPDEMRRWARHDPQMVDLARMLGVGPESTLLDVGCDSGGLIETLVAELGVRDCTGIDMNREAIVRGRALAGAGVELLQAEITTWRPERRFTHVFCVNALQYMHQVRAVAGMANMLAPAGSLVVAYETAFSDIARLRGEGFRQTLAFVRNLVFGTVVNILGRQPSPSIFGRKAYVSTRRLRRLVEQHGLEVLQVEARNKGMRVFGRPGQMILVARMPTS